MEKKLGFWERIFPKKEEKDTGEHNWMLTDSKPIFQDSGKDIYFSDFVNNAIYRIATEMSKIDVKSVVKKGDSVTIQQDDITTLFETKVNHLQVASDFLANVTWLRYKRNNAFIYPQYETITVNGKKYKRYIALYPLDPSAIYIGVGPDGSAWELKMEFYSKETGAYTTHTLPYSDFIHLRWRRGTNTTIGGGNDYGESNDTSLYRTVEALDKTIQGLPKSIEASLQIKGVFHTKDVLGQKLLNEARKNFEEHIITSKTGIVATDLVGDFTPINISPTSVPEETMKFLKHTISERYGVSPAILLGDFTGDQHAAFYQTAIEDLIIQFEQIASACLFSHEELRAGHRAKCYYNKVQYYAIKDKLELANIAKETGILNLDGIGGLFGFEPLPNGQGERRIQSLNFASIDLVDEYQKTRMREKEKNDGSRT